MKFVALVSGGKDSILSMMLAMRWGHTPVVLGNLCAAPLPIADCARAVADSDNVEEVDSFMFQTVGCGMLPTIAACMDLPLRQLAIRRGQSIEQMLDYTPHPSEDDEVEVLYRLLKGIKAEFPDVTAVVSGAILSHYQRLRVEAVCHRLGLVSIAPLWQCSAEDVLALVQHASIDARLVKVASAGLHPKPHLGRSLLDAALVKELLSLQRTHYLHAGGEGGEFETMVVDCPLFVAGRIRLDEMHVLVDAEQPDVASATFQHSMVVKPPLERSAANAGLQRFLLEPMPIVLHMQHLPRSVAGCDALLQSLLHRLVGSPIAPSTTNGRCLARRFEQTLANVPVDGTECRPPLWHASAFTSNPLLRTFHPLRDGGCTDGDCTANAVLQAADGLLAAIVTWLQAENREPLLLTLYCPNISLFAAVNAIYERHVSIVRPPCRAFLEDDTLQHLTVDVWSVPRATTPTTSGASPTSVVELLTQRKCLHVQSMSAWASASIGPYAQANRLSYRVVVGKDGGVTTHGCSSAAVNGSARSIVVDHTVVSGRIGMVPLTLQLATWDDLLQCCSCAASTNASNTDALIDGRRCRFVAEFLFMMANSLCGLTHFGHRCTEVTHATFYVLQQPLDGGDNSASYAATVSAIQAAWATCYAVNGESSPPSLVFDKDTMDGSEGVAAWWLPPARAGVVTHARLVLVSKMPKTAMVEVVLERRVGVPDDDEDD